MLPMTENNYPTDKGPVLTVKDLPKDEQPREKLLKYGVQSLTNAELFAIVLRTGSAAYPITDLCRDLMRMADEKLLLLERKSRRQIMDIKGVGPTKAMQIEAVMEIVRRYSRESIGERFQVRTASDVYALMKHEISNLPYEEIWVIFLNNTNHVIGKMRVSEGSSIATIFDVKKILRNALFEQAEGVVICHNHPSGTTRPSGADDSITRKCNDACKALDLRFLDHVIISTEGYFSYRDNTSLLD